VDVSKELFLQLIKNLN